MRNIPAQLGRGEVGVVTRDSLGREIVQTARFYVSRNLLARNLSEFAVNAGFVRRRYGVASTDYGPLAASIFYRRGLSSRLTMEATGEWTAGLLNAGIRGDLALGGFALVTAEARVSRDSATGRNGTLINLGIESSGSQLSGRIGATIPSAGYRDVAARLGDALPPKLYVMQVNYDLGSGSQFQLSATRQRALPDPRNPRLERQLDVINGTYRLRLNRQMDVFTAVSYRRGDTRGYSAYAGLSIQLGNGRTSQFSASAGSHTPFNASSSVRQTDIEGQPLGYAFDRSFGQSSRTSASVAWRANFGRVEGELEHVRGQFAARANARGTLIVAGGGVFARNRTGGTYALVKTGRVGAVKIVRENRPAGQTGRHGLLLVEDIPAQVPISFDVDADNLPRDALARDVKKRIIIARGSVGLVDLDVIRFVPRQVTLVDEAGNPLAAGLVIKSSRSGELSLVGYDGIVEVNAGEGDQTLVVGAGDRRCAVVLKARDLTAAPSRPFTCERSAAGTIAAAAEAGDGNPRHRRKRTERPTELTRAD